MDIHFSMFTNEISENEYVTYIEGACDSSETKPTELIADGSILVESDTGDVYFFNKKTSTWIKQFSFQG